MRVRIISDIPMSYWPSPLPLVETPLWKQVLFGLPVWRFKHEDGGWVYVNLKTNRPLTHAGRTQNIKQWAAEVGLSHQAIAYRLSAGWSIEEALTTPKDHGNGWHRSTRSSS